MLANLIRWIPTNIAGLLGILQAVVKTLKEIVTALINILCPLLGDKFDIIVYKVRDIINVLDSGLEKVKSFLLKVGI